MDTDTNISASTNPAIANKLAEQAMSDQEATATKAQVQLPPDPTLELPGGLLDPFNGLITTAQVRELTGADEEAVAKVNDIGKGLLTILERAVVKIGDETPDKDMLDALLSGDREAILLKIRMMTFGSEIKVGPLACSNCGDVQVFDIDLDKDVPIKKLEGDRRFTVSCKVGNVDLTLPTGSLQKEIVASSNKTSAELDTIILKNCIVSINNKPLLNTETVRALGLADRRLLLNEISLRNPGPQLREITKTCSACGQEVPLPLTLAELF